MSQLLLFVFGLGMYLVPMGALILLLACAPLRAFARSSG